MPEIIESESLNEKKLEEIGKDLRKGKLVVYPTETSYGLGTNALDKEAIQKIYKVKGRPEEKKLTVVVSNLDSALKYCSLNKKELKICKEFMPGPLTILADKNKQIPDLLNDRFAFRVPSNKIARDLSSYSEVPVIATSANLSGGGQIFSIESLNEKIKKKVDYIIDSGELEKTPASTIIDLSSGNLKLVREGPIKRKELEKFLIEND